MPNNGYQGKTWSAGEIITNTALNDIEHGIQDVVLIQDTKPTQDPNIYQNGAYNKIWVQPTINTVEVPTYEEFSTELINLKSQIGIQKQIYKGLIQSNNTWSDNAARNFMIVSCEPNDIVEITANSAQTFYAFLKSFTYPIIVNTLPDYCSGYSNRIGLASNSSIYRYVPSDCHYIYVMTNSGVDCTPDTIKINGCNILDDFVFQIGNIIRSLSISQWREGYINTNVATGASVNLNGVIAANYNYKILRCSPGNHIYLAGLGGGNARLWAFIDSSCTLLDKSDESASTGGSILTAPENAAFCIVNASGDIEARAVNIDDPIFNDSKSIVSFKNIGEMQELFTPESVYAFVASDRSDFGKGYRGNLFEYKKSATYEDIELDDGAFAKLVIPSFAPLKSNYECIDKILEIAYSYCGEKEEFPNGIPYAATSGPFRNDGKLSGIQCSQFVNAVLQGLTYENSKLSGKTTNTLLDGGCTWINTSPWASSNEGAMSANQLAHFAAAHGWLNQTHYFKDCEVGDVAFFAIDTPPHRAVNWNGIVHCAIVVEKQGNEIVCIGAGDILEPNESSPLLDASKQWYPNGTNAQAVTCQVIKDSTEAYWYNNRGLFGFGRFPVYYYNYKEVGTELANLKSMALGAYPTDTVSGTILSFDNGAEDVPLKAATVEIIPAQSGSGDPSPNNVRPISGWTSAIIHRTRKNLLPLTVEGIKAMQTTGGTWNGNTYTVTGVAHTILTDAEGNVTGIRVSGTPTGSRTLFKLCDFTAAFDAVLSGCPAGGSANDYELQFNGTNRDFGSGVSIAGDRTTGSVYIIVRPGYTASNLVFTPMIRTAFEEDSTFEPYYGTAYSITFPSEAGTVYGGTLDVTKGVLTVNRALLETTWGAGTFHKSIGNTITGKSFEDLQRFNSTITTTNNSVCNVCPPNIDEMNLESPHFYLLEQISAGSVYSRAYVYLPNDTSDDQVIQIAYPIRTPVTYQLTPVEVKSLLGLNILYADCGDMYATYRADPVLFSDSNLKSQKADVNAAINTLENKITALSERLELWAETLQTYTDQVTGTVNVHYTDPIIPEEENPIG